MKIVVTGGCGFIGSNFVRHLAQTRPHLQIVVFDVLTYAGNLANLSDVLDGDRVLFVRGDISDPVAARSVMEGVTAVVNFAAESHVDRSILDPAPFSRTNVLGTHVLLEVAREVGLDRFVHISTDEVYGSLGPEGKFTESSPLAPNSPYSASKAGGDLLVRAYRHTFGLPAVIVRSSNAYGPHQFPEKLIPLMILNALEEQPLPIYGDGMQVRDWVHVEDLSAAVLSVLEGNTSGEVYNVGGGNEVPNRHVVDLILACTGASPDLIRYVADRPGHDRRYAMDHSSITRELGWKPEKDFTAGIGETVEWYRSNTWWLEQIRTGAYRHYYARQYAERLAAGNSLGYTRKSRA